MTGNPCDGLSRADRFVDTVLEPPLIVGRFVGNDVKTPSLIPTICSRAAAVILSLAVITGIYAGIVPCVCAAAPAVDEPGELSEARARYEKDVEFATRPLRERYVQALAKVKKSLTFKGDLAGALMVQKEIESFGMGVGIARFAGDWVCTFASGSVHHYRIESDGTFYWNDRTPRKKLQASLKGNDYVVDFGDDNIMQRFTIAGNELKVEHFNPKTSYPKGPPALRGVGKRADLKK